MASCLVTRCPNCLAVFEVSSTQLAQAQGWLRCGQCAQTFDSTGLVVPWTDSRPEHAEQTQARMDLQTFLRQKDTGTEQTPVPEPLPPLSTPPADQALLAFEQALATFPGPDAHRLDLPQPNPSLEAAPSSRRALGKRLGLFLLGIAATLQLAWALHPFWRDSSVLGSAIQATETRTGWSVPAWRQPQALRIDSSSLERADGGQQLEWIVLNRSAWPAQAPALALDLNNAQGELIVRRVLLPSDVDAPVRIDPDGQWAGELLLDVPAELEITGYRLRAFYP